MKKISILGSTGSIGTQTLDIVTDHPDKFPRRIGTFLSFYPTARSFLPPRSALLQEN